MLKLFTGSDDVQVPSINQIQSILVSIGDKESSFTGSKEWLGSVESCYVIDELFGIPCVLHHISSEQKVSSKQKEIVDYFKNQGGLLVMGGDQDAGSKLIAGSHISSREEMSLLVIVSSWIFLWFWLFQLSIRPQDPHFVGKPKSAEDLIARGYVKWQREDDFMENSFYNLCMPKIVPVNK